MANTTTDNNPPKGTTTEPKTLRVEIAKYKSLLDALGDHKKVARFLFTVALLGILIFLGISLVALAIKLNEKEIRAFEAWRLGYVLPENAEKKHNAEAADA